MPDVTADVPLLRADDIDLARAALAVRGGAMLVVASVAPRADRAADKAFRASVEDFAVVDVSLTDAARLPVELAAHADPGAGRVVRLLLAPGDDLLLALNLHREKLRSPGARFVLWVPGQDAYRDLVRLAPDAFSFRDVVCIVRGDEPLPPRLVDEPSDALVAARARLARATAPGDRAAAWAAVVEELFASSADAAKREAEAFLTWASTVPSDQTLAMRRATARVLLYRAPNVDRNVVRQREDNERALSLLADAPSEEDRALKILLATTYPVPHGYGRDRERIAWAEEAAGSPLDRARAARARFTMQVARDDVSDLHAPPHVASQSDWNRGLATRDEAYRLSARGSYGPARLAFHEVASLGMSKTVALRAVARAREAALLLRMGELGASIRAATDLAETPGVDMALSVSARRTRALARASKGDLGAALGELRELLSLSADHGLPTDMLECAESVAWAVRCARVLGPLGEDEEAGLGEELAVAAARAEVIAGATPPWFRILFWGLRAWHLASRPEQIEEAIALQREALALAEREAELLAPEAGTLLAKLLCRLGAHEEAVRLVDRLEPVARREQILREVMRVTAVRWMASVRRGGDAAREESELLAAFHESGSLPAALRISRSVGEELARLGAADKAVRVLELALSYAEEIPWPEEQGRCLEALGRWDEASSLYARWGLTLRASLLVVRRGSGRF